MKVELIRDGAPECPLIRFYTGKPTDFEQLHDIAGRLAMVEAGSHTLDASKGFMLLGVCGLKLTNAADHGMIEEQTGSLVWSLPPDAWAGVAELIEPLCLPSSVGAFQWLDEAGRGFSTGLTVLASVSDAGHW